MKIDIFKPFFLKVENTPLYEAWMSIGKDIKFYSGGMSAKYKNTIDMLIFLYPKLLYFAIYNSILSFVKRNPDYLIVDTDVEALCASVVKFVLRRNTKIILLCFIFTKRSTKAVRAVRKYYYKFILSRCHRVICHSKYEVRFFSRYFGIDKGFFYYVPYALHVVSPKDNHLDFPPPYIVSAGRSNRDYKTLATAAENLPYKFIIICDGLNIPNCPANVEIVSGCYGKDYIDILRGAELVVIPLVDQGISAGQMVLLQAMALGKAVVITKVKANVDYLCHNKTAYTVRARDVDELRMAIVKLMENNKLRGKISKQGNMYYSENHTFEKYVKNIALIFESSNERAFL